MSGCVMCGKRSVMYGIENGNKSMWQLSYDEGLPVLRVMIDNNHLGITLSSEMIIHNCPICGKGL